MCAVCGTANECEHRKNEEYQKLMSNLITYGIEGQCDVKMNDVIFANVYDNIVDQYASVRQYPPLKDYQVYALKTLLKLQNLTHI